MARKLTTEEFIERAKSKHGNFYDYSKVEYVSSHKDVIIICPIHEDFSQSLQITYQAKAVAIVVGVSRFLLRNFRTRPKSYMKIITNIMLTLIRICETQPKSTALSMVIFGNRLIRI